MSELAPVRDEERFDAERVLAYLCEHGFAMEGGLLEVAQFRDGHSNLTYAIRCGGWEAVLRRPPLGPVAPRAHDMEREFRILSRLAPVYPLAPRPYLYCGDTAIMGSPFYVMERRQGLVLDTKWPAGLDPALRPAIGEAVVDTLADLHAVDYREAGLDELGHPAGYMERQVQGWIGRYDRAKTGEIDVVPALCRWLTEHTPAVHEATMVHNDFKLNNVLLDRANPAQVTAVLDWEMATIGDPLSDLGTLLGYWSEPGDEQDLGALVSVTAQPGFLSRDAVLERYARRTGRNVDGIHFYLAFAFFKIAVICQQIYFRWAKGQTRDERFRGLGQVAENLIRRSYRTALRA